MRKNGTLNTAPRRFISIKKKLQITQFNQVHGSYRVKVSNKLLKALGKQKKELRIENRTIEDKKTCLNKQQSLHTSMNLHNYFIYLSV